MNRHKTLLTAAAFALIAFVAPASGQVGKGLLDANTAHRGAVDRPAEHDARDREGADRASGRS